jgi:hypothetical protein
MTDEGVMLRLYFNRFTDAVTFREDFAGSLAGSDGE